MRTNIFIITISIFISIILWISISLTYEYYADIDVPIRLVNYPRGYTISGEIPDKVSIKIKGAGWKILLLDIGHSIEYLASVGRETGKKRINLYDKISENQWLTDDLKIIDIYPDTITVNITRQIEKTVRIIPNLNLTFKQGYGLASEIKIEPDSVVISGSANVVNKINEVITHFISLDNLSESVTKSTSLQGVKNVNFSLNNVQVKLDVQQIVDKELSDIEILTEGVPVDEELILLPNRITIGLRGGINILGKLDSSDVKAKIHFSKVISDTLGSLVPEIITKKNLNIFYIRPERIKYIIKKLK